MWLLYVFIISSLGVLVLLFAKIRELNTGRQTVVGKTLAKADPFVQEAVHRLLSFLHHHSERAFFLFLVHLPSRAETYSKHLRAKAHDYYHGVNRKIRGKRDFPNGAASPYMRSMYFRRGDGNGRV